MAKSRSKKDEFDEALEEEVEIEKKETNSAKNKIIKAYHYLNEKFDFRFNVITMEHEYKLKEDKEFKFFDDEAYRDIDQMVSLYATSIGERYFKNWVRGSKLSKKYDPFKDYIFGLPKWDKKTDHIEKFLKQIYLDDEQQSRAFLNDAFKRWFVAMVGGLVDDRTKNQTCFVLAGKQGTFKTTFLDSIVPDHLQMDYLYSSDFKVDNKDHEKYLYSKMLINFDELQSFNRNDIEGIKTRISQSRVVLRLPFGKADTKAWRKASFCGSVNKDEFLNDATGSRRFLAFKVDRIVIDHDFDIGLLYAQGLYLFKDKFKYWFDAADIATIEAHNDQHQSKTMEEEYVISHFAVPTKDEIRSGVDVQYLTATDVMDKICAAHPKVNANNTVNRAIGVSLQGNGFKKYSKSVNGKSSKMWCVKAYHGNPDITELDGSALPGELDRPII